MYFHKFLALDKKFFLEFRPTYCVVMVTKYGDIGYWALVGASQRKLDETSGAKGSLHDGPNSALFLSTIAAPLFFYLIITLLIARSKKLGFLKRTSYDKWPKIFFFGRLMFCVEKSKLYIPCTTFFKVCN